jgi:hypothetical protein
MVNGFMRKRSASLAIKEMQIKVRFPLTPIGHQEYKQQEMLARVEGGRNTYTRLVGVYPSAATMEISMEASQKTKNRITT